MSWVFAADIDASPCASNDTVTAPVSPGTASRWELTGCPPAAEVHAPRPGSRAGPSAGIPPYPNPRTPSSNADTVAAQTTFTTRRVRPPPPLTRFNIEHVLSRKLAPRR
jgi:hypothetical protein